MTASRELWRLRSQRRNPSATEHNDTELNRSEGEQLVWDQGVCKSKSAKLSCHSERSRLLHRMYSSTNKQAVLLEGSSQYVQENLSLVQLTPESLSAVIHTLCRVYHKDTSVWTTGKCFINNSDTADLKKGFFLLQHLLFFPRKAPKLCSHETKCLDCLVLTHFQCYFLSITQRFIHKSFF